MPRNTALPLGFFRRKISLWGLSLIFTLPRLLNKPCPMRVKTMCFTTTLQKIWPKLQGKGSTDRPDSVLLNTARPLKEQNCGCTLFWAHNEVSKIYNFLARFGGIGSMMPWCGRMQDNLWLPGWPVLHNGTLPWWERGGWGKGEEDEEGGRKEKKTVGKKLNMGSVEEVRKKRKEGQMEREGRGKGGREGQRGGNEKRQWWSHEASQPLS